MSFLWHWEKDVFFPVAVGEQTFFCCELITDCRSSQQFYTMLGCSLLIRASGDFLLLVKCCARNPLINIELNHKWWGQKRGLSTNSSVVTYDRLPYGKRNHNDHWFEWKIKLFHFSWNYAIFFFVLYLLPPCKWFFLDSLWFGWNEHTFARRQKKTITAIPPIETMTAVYDGEVLPLTKVSRNEMGAYLCNISAIIHTIYLFTYWAIRYFCFVYIILQVSVSMR